MQLFSEIVTLTVTHPRKKWQEFCRLARDKKITHSPKSTNSSFLIQTPPPANTRLPAPHSPTAYWMTANSLHARRKHIKILERESLRIISSSTLSCLVLILRHGRSFSLFRQWVLRWIVRSRCLLKVRQRCRFLIDRRPICLLQQPPLVWLPSSYIMEDKTLFSANLHPGICSSVIRNFPLRLTSVWLLSETWR